MCLEEIKYWSLSVYREGEGGVETSYISLLYGVYPNTGTPCSKLIMGLPVRIVTECTVPILDHAKFSWYGWPYCPVYSYIVHTLQDSPPPSNFICCRLFASNARDALLLDRIYPMNSQSANRQLWQTCSASHECMDSETRRRS